VAHRERLWNSATILAPKRFSQQNAGRGLMDGPDSLIDDSEGAARLLVDSVVDYAIYLLSLDGTIKSWNAGAQRTKGYNAKEIIGSNFSVF
jgi:PAS domain-containing protein